jgi:hypothetical protein
LIAVLKRALLDLLVLILLRLLVDDFIGIGALGVRGASQHKLSDHSEGQNRHCDKNGTRLHIGFPSCLG